MIHFKNNSNGFTLLEVLFALVILASILTPLILNQTRFLGRLGFQSELLARTYAGEKFMLDAHLKFEQDNQQRTVLKSIDDPQSTLRSHITDPSKRIKKEFNELYKQEVAIEWEEDGVKRKDNLITFLFLPELETT